MQWVRDAYSTLACLVGLPPVPGTGRHLELRYQARREYVEENRKAEGQRDPERVRRLRRRELELSVEECEVRSFAALALPPRSLLPPHKLSLTPHFLHM